MEKANKLSGVPVNSKSLLAFICNQMARLSNGEIGTNEACAQAKLASQACNILNYELKRSIVQMQLNKSGYAIENKDVRLRDIESKSFDETKCD